jgi:predicted metal-binding protein
MEKIKEYKHIYLIVLMSDGTIPWKKDIDENKLTKKVDRGLKGVAAGMPLEFHRQLLKIRDKIHSMILIPGCCKQCKECNVKGKCLKGTFAHSPEGIGIDVLNTLHKLDIDIIEEIPHNRIVNVGFICTSKEIRWV